MGRKQATTPPQTNNPPAKKQRTKGVGPSKKQALKKGKDPTPSYDRTQFRDHKAQNEYNRRFCHRTVACGRPIDKNSLAKLDKHKFLEGFKKQGWLSFLCMDREYYPDLVRIFYANLTGDEDNLESFVNGKEISITPEIIAEYIGAKAHGGEAELGQVWTDSTFKPLMQVILAFNRSVARDGTIIGIDGGNMEYEAVRENGEDPLDTSQGEDEGDDDEESSEGSEDEQEEDTALVEQRAWDPETEEHPRSLTVMKPKRATLMTPIARFIHRVIAHNITPRGGHYTHLSFPDLCILAHVLTNTPFNLPLHIMKVIKHHAPLQSMNLPYAMLLSLIFEKLGVTKGQINREHVKTSSYINVATISRMKMELVDGSYCNCPQKRRVATDANPPRQRHDETGKKINEARKELLKMQKMQEAHRIEFEAFRAETREAMRNIRAQLGELMEKLMGLAAQSDIPSA